MHTRETKQGNGVFVNELRTYCKEEIGPKARTTDRKIIVLLLKHSKVSGTESGQIVCIFIIYKLICIKPYKDVEFTSQ